MGDTDIAARVLLVERALCESERLLRESILHYQGNNLRVAATLENDFGRTLQLVRAAQEQPPWVPPWEEPMSETDHAQFCEAAMVIDPAAEFLPPTR